MKNWKQVLIVFLSMTSQPDLSHFNCCTNASKHRGVIVSYYYDLD